MSIELTVNLIGTTAKLFSNRFENGCPVCGNKMRIREYEPEELRNDSYYVIDTWDLYDRVKQAYIYPDGTGIIYVSKETNDIHIDESELLYGLKIPKGEKANLDTIASFFISCATPACYSYWHNFRVPLTSPTYPKFDSFNESFLLDKKKDSYWAYLSRDEDQPETIWTLQIEAPSPNGYVEQKFEEKIEFGSFLYGPKPDIDKLRNRVKKLLVML